MLYCSWPAATLLSFTKLIFLSDFQALLSCPTSSIHTEKPPKDMLKVQNMFPLPSFLALHFLKLS